MDYDDKLCRIVQLRGLGWSQEDIAGEVGLSEKSVSYRLNKLEELSKKEGTHIFWEIVAVAGIRNISKKYGKIEKIL
ncbi:MAG: winged helix-turn-helix transcriptional regulator [Candidatus Altiarchaeota archaeon]